VIGKLTLKKVTHGYRNNAIDRFILAMAKNRKRRKYFIYSAFYPN
jgi:hypothetical protein